MGKKQPYSYQGKCRRRAGTQWKFPAALERSMLEQPLSTTEQFSTCSLHRSPQHSRWMWPERGESPCRRRPLARWSTRSVCNCHPCWSSLFPKDSSLWYRPITEQTLKNCSLREAHRGSVLEELHPVEGMPCWSRVKE